ncbi:MAG: hypothetical protein AAFN18_16710 [Cyanobacteria bacterium J06554_6]
MPSQPVGIRLEQYTLKYPQEVLMVRFETADEPDEVVIFKGFSSSLMRPTAFDPDVPTIPEQATIAEIDRLQGPYQPDSPQYLEQAIPWSEFKQRLEVLGL